MDKIDINELGRRLSGITIIYSADLAIEEIAVKINEIVDFINDKKDQLL